MQHRYRQSATTGVHHGSRDPQLWVHTTATLPHPERWMKELKEYSLFAQYVERKEQMPREQQDGHVEYKPQMLMDFYKLSRRLQVLELQTLGMEF